jgi:hypothetical protein
MNGSDEFFRKFNETYPIGSIRVIMHLPPELNSRDVWFSAMRDHTDEPFRSRLIDEHTIESSDEFQSRQTAWTIQA